MIEKFSPDLPQGFPDYREINKQMAINAQMLLKAVIECQSAVLPEFDETQSIEKCVEIFEKYGIDSAVF